MRYPEPSLCIIRKKVECNKVNICHDIGVLIKSFADYETLCTMLLQIMSDNESKSDKLLQTWRKYMGETSIHGLKYICEDKTKPMERAFWIVAVFLSLIMAITLVHGVSARKGRHWPSCKI